jgi:Tol biopolymer transport system component
MGVGHRMFSVVAGAALVAAGCTGIARVSVSSSHEQGNGESFAPAISEDGRIVAFTSSADDLVPGDTNFSNDVFIRNTAASTTRRVSVTSDGTEVQNSSSGPVVSSTGRYVAFSSFAENLAPGDGQNDADAFIHDRVTGDTTLVSKNFADGAVANAISDDGRYVLFTVESNPVRAVYLADTVSGSITQQSDLSNCDGLGSGAPQLEVAQATMDEDASTVAYWLRCTIGPSLFVVVLHDVATGDDTIVVQAGAGDVTASAGDIAFADDGRTLATWLHTVSGRGGENQTGFLWRAGKGTVDLAVPAGGFAPRCVVERCADVSPNGRYLAFETSSGLDGFSQYVCPCRVALLDLVTGAQFDVSQSTKFAPRDGHEPVFEGDGNRIAFSSEDGDLVFDDDNGASDVFTRSVQGVIEPGHPGTFIVGG